MKRQGLTLLELVVVMAILAVLATVAVVMTEGTVDQARYDVTLRTLEAVDLAVMGPPTGSPNDDYRGLQGFIADVGRPPLAFGANTDDGSQLAELWSNPNSLRAYAPAATSDPSIIVHSGWRGSYVRLPSTGAPLLDGWGQPLKASNAAGTSSLAANDPIGRIFSSGGSAPPYSSALLNARAFATQTGTISGSIVDAVATSASSMNLEVRLFVPDGTSASGVREYHRTFDQNGTDTTNEASTANTGFQFLFPDPTHYPTNEGSIVIPIGPKALRITQGTTVRQVVYFWLDSSGYSKTFQLDLK